jgi:hypothetical protein
MMLPILISLSLAPGSYFLSARAALIAQAMANAATATRMICVRIDPSPDYLIVGGKCRNSTKAMQAMAIPQLRSGVVACARWRGAPN